jgi:peptidoglycan hydrolase CwlO-like protein
LKIRATVMTLAIAASLGVPAGVALAEPGNGQGDGPRSPEAMCERAENRVKALHKLERRLEMMIAKLTRLIESGKLEGERLEHAQAKLERLQNRLARLSERIAAIEAKIAERCDGTDAATQPA